MKIGIITQPLRANYGGVLQNYALQQALISLGHNPVTIDFAPFLFKKNTRWYIRLGKRLLAQKILKVNSIQYINPETQDLSDYRVHREFIDKYISYIVQQYPLKSTLTNEEKFDAYIAGSDQVWRPYCHDFIDDCYFGFTEGQDVIRMSYAASFGLDKWTYTEEKTLQVKRWAQGYNAISVREDAAIKLCHDYLGVDAKHVVDPTLLLTAEQYKKVLSRNDYIYDGEVLVYILDMNDKKKNIISEICRKMNKKPFYVGKPINGQLPSIQTWLAGFDKAEFVITDSFHGTVFSIIFKKQFINIGNLFRGLSRISSLFNIFNIDNSHVIAEETSNIDIPMKIDYSKVHTILQDKREEAFLFLRDNLK